MFTPTKGNTLAHEPIDPGIWTRDLQVPADYVQAPIKVRF